MNKTIKDIYDGSAENLNIVDALDSVKYHERGVSLEEVCKKISYGGTIELSGLDYNDLIRACLQGYIRVEEFNNLIYGNNSLSLSNLELMEKKLSELGFTVITRRRNGYRYYIKARRSVK